MGSIDGKRHLHNEAAPTVELDRVTVYYNGAREHPALEEVSFRLERGEQVAIVGPNGAGKSTLFKVLAGILRPASGDVKIYGHGPGGHICIAYVPQRSQVDWTFPVNVAEAALMGRIGKIGLLRHAGPKDWEYVRQCLELVGMSDLAKRQIGELSGGQQQRVFIARALAQEAELMLLDEPLTGLDVKSQEDIFAVLEKLRRRRVTVLVATHDLNLAAERFDRLMLLNRRIVGLGRASEVFTPELLSRAYGGQMRLVQTANGLVALGDTCCDGGEHRHG